MTRVLVSAVAALMVALPQSTPARPSVRFHHFHFRVNEPAAAMNAGMATLEGSRVLLRGLGVGVRVGREYALFDRAEAPERSDGGPPVDAAYTVARDWLRGMGVEVTDLDEAVRAKLAATFGRDDLDHVAFAAADPSAAIAALIARGARATRKTDASTFFRASDSSIVEIVRDPDAPDAFWCPMHPDVRSSATGKCPICGMELVPIPPPRLGEYRMDVAMTAGPNRPGISGFRITLRDPESGKPVPGFATIHERLLHLFIIDRRLEYFQHVHPTPAGNGRFALHQVVPPGAYVILADFLPQGGRSQMLQRAIVTPGYAGPVFTPAPDLSSDRATEKTVAGIRVQLGTGSVRAGKEALFRFTLTDAATGAPVTDLEPFLGAPGHMLIVNADLTEADHVHPDESSARGPSITFQPLFPAAGFYKLWLQFQRLGAVSTIPFVVSAEGR